MRVWYNGPGTRDTESSRAMPNPPDPTRTLPGKAFKEHIKRCFVYGWKRGNEFLYIGQAKFGFQRLCRHDIIGIEDEIRDDDELVIWYTTIEEIHKLEYNLINFYKPLYNNFRNRKYRGEKKNTPKKATTEISVQPNHKYEVYQEEVLKCPTCGYILELSPDKKHCSICYQRLS